MSIEFTPEAMQALVDETVEQVAAIDAQLVTLRGTIGEMQAKGLESVNAMPVNSDSAIKKDDSDDPMPGLLQTVGSSLRPDIPVGEFVSTLQSMLDAATAWRQAEVSHYVGAHQATSDDADLRATRAELTANYTAAAQLLKSMFKIEVPALPDEPPSATQKGGTRSTSTGGTKNLRFFYYKKDGTKNYKKNNANRLSTVAYQQFGQAKEADLRAALPNTDFFHDWEGEVTCNGITVRMGWEVVSDSETDSEQG